ncbi:MAG: hypothetical protein AAB642_03090 [Patescibacteria group bacterium]
MKSEVLTSSQHLPLFFKPLFWSYDFNALDLERYKKTIILNTINYGNLEHWRWIISFYSKDIIRNLLATLPVTELRPPARNLAGIIFELDNFNHAPRGAHQ